MRIEYYGERLFGFVEPSNGYRIAGSMAHGSYGFTFTMTVRLEAQAVATEVNLVTLSGLLIIGATPVATLHRIQGRLPTAGREPKTVEVSVQALLDLRQVNALHDSRGTDGNLNVSIALHFGLHGPQGGFDSFAQDSVTFAHSAWMEALRMSGFGPAVLCEIAVPIESNDTGLVAGVEALRRARSHVRESDVVANCRIALDDANVGTSFPGQMQINFAGRAREDVTVDERLALLRWAANMAMHPPHHTTTVNYDRDQARLLLQVTAALLEYEARTR